MEIRFDESRLLEFADRYKINDLEYEIQDLFRNSIKPFEFITKEQLKLIAYWKSPRIMKQIESNSTEFIKETSAIALSVKEEKLRIGVLTILKGVSYPVASAILHFVHRDRYPIIDYRALWSMGAEIPSQYTFPFWWKYVETCRDLALRNQVTMRTLDRALWQYSKEHQK